MSNNDVNTSELRKKASLLMERLEWSIKDVGNKRRTNQRRATLIKLLVLFSSTGATILLGLNIFGVESLSRNVAFTLTAIVMVLTALEPFFNFRALWIETEQSKAKFSRLLDELRYYLEGKSDEQLEDGFLYDIHVRYQLVWDELSDAWISERRRGFKKQPSISVVTQHEQDNPG